MKWLVLFSTVLFFHILITSLDSADILPHEAFAESGVIATLPCQLQKAIDSTV